MKATENRIIIWLGWIVGWVAGFKFMNLLGFVGNRGIVYLVLEAILCCIGAEIMIHSKLVTVITLIIMTIRFIFGFSVAGVFWYGMSILLYILTRVTAMPPQVQKIKKALPATTSDNKQSSRQTNPPRQQPQSTSTKTPTTVKRVRRRLK